VYLNPTQQIASRPVNHQALPPKRGGFRNDNLKSMVSLAHLFTEGWRPQLVEDVLVASVELFDVAANDGFVFVSDHGCLREVVD
jgi:hypothetical protein